MEYKEDGLYQTKTSQKRVANVNNTCQCDCDCTTGDSRITIYIFKWQLCLKNII